MLMEKASVDICQNAADPNTAPVTAGAVYVAGQPEIHVPVYPIAPDRVFAPPFLIPRGEWTLIFELQAPGLVFYAVSYKDKPAGPTITNDDTPGKTTWTTTFDTNKVISANKLHCKIELGPPFSNSDPTYSGDPTIAVVQDPMGG
jgi:hypothetical protein